MIYPILAMLEPKSDQILLLSLRGLQIVYMWKHGFKFLFLPRDNVYTEMRDYLNMKITAAGNSQVLPHESFAFIVKQTMRVTVPYPCIDLNPTQIVCYW